MLSGIIPQRMPLLRRYDLNSYGIEYRTIVVAAIVADVGLLSSGRSFVLVEVGMIMAPALADRRFTTRLPVILADHRMRHGMLVHLMLVAKRHRVAGVAAMLSGQSTQHFSVFVFYRLPYPHVFFHRSNARAIIQIHGPAML